MELSVEELFSAYFDCRSTKRWSLGAVAFEVDYERNLLSLYDDLERGTWKPGKSSCFIVTEPVPREIFAAPFRDRIVHHLLINRLNPFFESYFIRDSFACRKGKGVFAAIRRLEHFVRSGSANGSKECWVLKIDIKGFFMSVNRALLCEKLERFIDFRVAPAASPGAAGQPLCIDAQEAVFLKSLVRKIVLSDPTENCVVRSGREMWKLLPRDKSLFTCKKGCGLPIGNLTSQVFANFYLSEFDHFVKHTLRIKRYVRYVDDCVIVHEDGRFLRMLVPVLKKFLADNLELTLHPKKIYLQDARHGVEFLGAFIKPSHTTSGRRIKGNFSRKLLKYERLASDHKPTGEELSAILSSVNSYLGIMRHFATKRFRVGQLVRHFSDRLKQHFSFKGDGLKIEKKKSSCPAGQRPDVRGRDRSDELL